MWTCDSKLIRFNKSYAPILSNTENNCFEFMLFGLSSFNLAQTSFAKRAFEFRKTQIPLD